jgi:hypothetical protein
MKDSFHSWRMKRMPLDILVKEIRGEVRAEVK